MKALLIIAKGSRNKNSNDEIRRLADRINENLGPAFGLATSAFLDISSPHIDSAVADLVEEGATEVQVLPYYLSGGTNVTKDIPAAIEEEKAKYPTVRFEILPHFGALQGISTLILNHIYKSGSMTN